MIDYDELAENYGKFRQVHPEVFRALVAGSGVTRESKVLEVGSGTGNYVIALQQATGCQAWGVEPSDRMRETAQGRTRDVRFSAGRAEDIGLTGIEFDLVFTVDVIHFIKDRAAYMRNAHALLRSGGRVCTGTDDREIIMARRPLTNYFPETVPFELERYPKDGEVQGLMQEAGFRGIREDRVRFEKDVTDIGLWKNKASSTLNLIPEEAFQRGIAKMEADLQKGPIRWVSPYLLIWGTK